MAKKASTAKERARGDGASGRRSGQGAGSALNETLRRQAQNPRPGVGTQAPASGERERSVGEPRPAGQRRSSGK
jgi:hypothetical protein